MDERHREPEQPPTERVERHEVVERDGVNSQPRRAATPMWVWVVPLVLVVIFLVWFIFTRGQPASPIETSRSGGGPADGPDVEVLIPDRAPEAPDIDIDISNDDVRDDPEVVVTEEDLPDDPPAPDQR